MFWIGKTITAGHDYQAVKRFLKILETMARYGFCELAETIRPHHHYNRIPCGGDIIGLSRPEKLRKLFEELGPTFVKLGQILSTRPDLIPEEYAEELTKLTEQVTPFPEDEAMELLKKELGRDPHEIFSDFSHTPIAAASIGQVYAGKIADGTEVVIKLRRPGVVQKIGLDLEILRYIAARLEEFDPQLARLQLPGIVEEFAYSLSRELDYRYEIANILKFTRNMAETPKLKIPKVYPEWSSAKVLVLERIRGKSVGEILASGDDEKKKYPLKELAENGVDLLLEMIFEYGFFHADPHPGNIFVLEDGLISFIDFGMMGKVSNEERHDFVKIIDYMLRDRIDLMARTALRMTVSGKIRGDFASFERDTGDIVDENINLPMERLSVARILESLLHLFRKYEIVLKPNLYLMFKALITIEKIGRSFDPHMQIVERVKPFISRLKLRSYNPKPYLMRFLDSLGDNLNAVQDMPVTARNVLDLLEDGKLSIRLEHHRLDEIEDTFFMTGERLARSLVMAALIIGSALIIVAKMPPLWEGIPVVGAGGFVFSGLLGLVMLLDDFRQRRKFVRERHLRKLRQYNGRS